MKGEGRVGDRLNCDEEIGGTRLKCIHRVHGHLGARPVYSRFIRQDLFHGGGKGGQERNAETSRREEKICTNRPADCQLPYKYINIYIYKYRIVVALYQDLPKISIGLHPLLLSGVDFLLEEVLPSKLKPRATSRAAGFIFFSRHFLLPHFPLCWNGRGTGSGSREHPRQAKRSGRDTFVEWS